MSGGARRRVATVALAAWLCLAAQQAPTPAPAPAPAPVPAPAAAPEPPPPVSPAALAITEMDLDVALPLAVQQAADGDFAGAIARLTAAGSAVGASAEIDVELARIRGLDALRGQQLEWRRSNGQSVQLETTKGKVSRIAADAVTLDTGGKLRTFPLAAVTPEVLLRWQRQAGPEGVDGQVLATAWTLTRSDELRKNTLDWVSRGSGLAPEALKARFEAEHARIETAGVARTLLDLTRQAVPVSSGPARAQLVLIEALLPEQAARPLVASRLPELVQLARQALGLTFDGSPIANLGLRGDVEALGPDRVRLTYSFDDPAQLADFEPVDSSYLRYIRESLGALDARWGARRSEVQDGQLLLGGPAALRSNWSLAAPWTIRFKLRYPREIEEAKQIGFLLGFCDDAHESLIQCDLSYLDVIDKHTGLFKRAVSPLNGVFVGTDYSFDIVHDGTTVRLTVDDGVPLTVPAGPRTSGALLLWSHSELDITIEDLVVEGRLDPAFVAQRREAWIALGLAAMGVSAEAATAGAGAAQSGAK